MRYLSSSLTLFPFSRTCQCQFKSLKKSNFSSKFDSTHSCSISANVLFRKRPLDITILFGPVYINLLLAECEVRTASYENKEGKNEDP